MSDQANIVGKVTTDVSQSVRAANELTRAVAKAGGAWAGFAVAGSKAIDQLGSALGKFNLAIGGVQKGLQLLHGAMDLVKFSAETKQLEMRMRELGISTANLTGAVGGSVDKLSLMKFALKQVQGESALMKGQMELVLKAAETLNDRGFGDTIEIAEAMAKALKGGSTKALLEYNIKIEETGDKQKDLNGLMDEFVRIANNPPNVNAQLEAVDQLQAATQNWINDMKSGLGTLLMMAAQLADSMSDQIAGVTNRAHVSMAISPEEWRKMTPEQRAAEVASMKARMATFGKPDASKPKITTWAGDMVLTNKMPTDGAAKKKGAGKGRGGSRGPTYDGVMSSALADLQAEFDADDFAYEGSNQQRGDAGNNDAAALLERLKASTTDLQGTFAGLAESLGYADNEYTRALELQQARIDQNLEEARTLDVMAGSLNLAGSAFWNLGEAMASGNASLAQFLRDLSRGVLGMGKDAFFKSIYYLAEGWANPNPLERGRSFTAAKFYATAAAIAVPTAAAIGAMASASGGGGGGGGASPGSPSAGGFAGGAIGGGSGGGSAPFTINVQGNLYGDPTAFGRAVADGLDAAQRSGRTRLRSNRYH